MFKQIIIICAISCQILTFAQSTFAATEPLPLKFDVNLTKKIYSEGEPIIVVLSLSNIQSTELTVAEPLVLEGFVTIKITGLDGNEPNVPKLIWDIAMPPENYGIKITPGQILKVQWSLNESYVYGFEPGIYALTITYDTDKFSKNYPEIWHGKINAPKITLSVKEPSPEQKNAYELLKSANRIIIGFERDKYPQARNLLLNLLKNEPNSVYTPYAAYLLGESYFIKQADKKQHFSEASRQYEQFLSKFPNYPYYSDLVRTTKLPFSLIQIGQREKAKEILREVPNGYYKQRTSKILEKGLKPRT